MKNIKFLLFSAFVFISMFAQVDRTYPPKPGIAPKINIGEAESFTLENGLKVFVVENHKIPKVTFSFDFDYQFATEGEKTGLSEITGELIGTGTESKSKSEIDESVDFIGANINSTSRGISGSVLSKFTEYYFSILSDVILNAKFEQSELEKLQKQTVSGLKSEEAEPNAIASKVTNSLIFGKKSPYGEIKTEQTVKSITLDDVKTFYKNNFVPNVTYLAIVGDIDKNQAEKLVNKYLAKWQKGEVTKSEFEFARQPFVRKVAVVDRPNAVQSVIHVATPLKFKQDSKDLFAAKVANSIFGGGFTSRLNLNLREKHGFTYGVRSSLMQDELMGSLDISCEVRNSVTDSSLSEILSEMKKMRNELVSSKELDAIKKYMVGSFALSLEQPETIAKFAINIAKYNLPTDFYETYLEKIEKVTAEDVQAVSKKYLDPEKIHLIVVGSNDQVGENLKKLSPNGKINYYDTYGNEVDISAKNLPTDITAEQVVDKYYEAIGGKEKISQVKDEQVIMKGNVQGYDLEITISRKFPNKFYFLLDIGIMQQIQKYDGKNAMVSGMQGEKILEGEELETMKIESEMNSLLRAKELGIELKLVGIEDVNGKKAYKIDVVKPKNNITTEYYDISTGLKLQEISTRNTEQGQFTTTIVYGEYKDFNGYKFPGTISQSVAGQSFDLTVESYIVNSGLEDGIFVVETQQESSF